MAPRAPAHGERTALGGYVPQYEVAAALVLDALHEERLVRVGIADPEAERLDDLQIESPMQLDAYQVKWSREGKPIMETEFRSLLADLVGGSKQIKALLSKQGRSITVVAHLYSNRPASSNGLKALPDRSLQDFISEVWLLAEQGRFAAVEELPGDWRDFWIHFANDCGVAPDDLLQACPSLRVELDRVLPSDALPPGREGERYAEDLRVVRSKLFDLVIDRDQPVWLTLDELLDRLGNDWPERLQRRSDQEFPLPRLYEQIETTARELRKALRELAGGYLILLGSPGSGKSTLLTELLRTHSNLVARYYAYVRDRPEIGPARRDAGSFLHDLVLELESRGIRVGQTPADFDPRHMAERLRAQLARLAEQVEDDGPAIILIDGLDHVGRPPRPDVPLLDYLPEPDAVPDGVLIVLGSQTDQVLRSSIRLEVEKPERRIEIAPLDRTAVGRLAATAGLDEFGDQLWEASAGHPLMLQLLFGHLAAAEPQARGDAIVRFQPLRGDLTRLYEQIWDDIGDDVELIELLGLACRLRGPIELTWLENTGSAPEAVRKLERVRQWFRRETGSRWFFFHDSFQLFLRERTAQVTGQFDAERDKRFHRDLARRCSETAIDRSQAWEELHHLAAAGEHTTVLDKADPQYFRRQLLALRPVEQVGADVRQAAGSLRIVHDPLAFVRLVLASSELSVRESQFASGPEFLRLLIGLGKVDAAVAHALAREDRFSERKNSLAALRITPLLARQGYEREARQLFEANEPLDLLGGPPARVSPLEGPWQLLYAWARGAVVFHGVERLVEGAASVSLPEDHFGDESPQSRQHFARAHMLAAGAMESVDRGRDEDVDRILSELDLSDAVEAQAWFAVRYHEWARLPRASDEAHAILEEARERVGKLLDDEDRLELGDAFFLSGDSRAAAELVDSIEVPVVPTDSSLREDMAPQHARYRYFRLRSVLGERPDPVEAVPDADRDSYQGAVYMGRQLVVVAQLDGRRLAGERVTPGDIERLLRRVLALYDRRNERDWIGSMGMGSVGKFLQERLIDLAALESRAALARAWSVYEQRWARTSGSLIVDGTRILAAFAAAGMETEVTGRLQQLEVLLDETGESDSETWQDLATAWLRLGRSDEADRLLRRITEASFAVGFRKDYQLSEWIRLLEPKLRSDGGAQLSLWLGQGIVGLDKRLESAGTHDAALSLLRIELATRPTRGIRLGESLVERRIVDDEDLLSVALAATAGTAGPWWWTVLAELLVPCTESAYPDLVQTADLTATSIDALHDVGERVAVEGRPTLRLAWRGALVERARRSGSPPERIGISDGDLEPSEEAPSRRDSGSESEYTRERETWVRERASREGLFGALQDDPTKSEIVQLVREVADDLGTDDLVEVASVLHGQEPGAHACVSLARRALDLGDSDLAARLARQAIEQGQARDWRRWYDGGPVLEAVALLAEIDEPGAVALAYRRLGELASTDEFLLSEIAGDLSRFVQLLRVPDTGAVAESVLAYVEVLLAGVQFPELPEPVVPDELAALDPLGLLTVRFLESPYTLPGEAAQRLLLSGLRHALPEANDVIEAALARSIDDGNRPLRALGVAAAAALEGHALGDHVLELVSKFLVADDLVLRAAAQELLKRIGLDVEAERRGGEMPPALQLTLPGEPHTPGIEGAKEVGADSLDEMLHLLRSETEQLAKAGGVDPDAMEAYIRQLARRRADGPIDDSAPSRRETIFGWGYTKPSVLLIREAQGEVAAQLFDAGLFDGWTPLFAARLWPPYDERLLVERPARRPAGVVPARSGEKREIHYGQKWLDEIGDVEGRLIREQDGLMVIAEDTRLRQLEREGPQEDREQGLAVGESDSRFSRCGWFDTATDYPSGADFANEGPIVLRQLGPVTESPSSWLALNPEVALQCGWEPDPTHLLGWRKGLRPRVWSYWWRSGWLYARPYSSYDEVGEGWLVLAVKEAVAEIAETLPGELCVGWKVERSFFGEGTGTRTEQGGLRI